MQLTKEEVEKIEFVEISLLNTFMECWKTGWQGEEGEEKEEFLQKQNKRKEVLKMKLQAEKLVVVPVQHSGHYFSLAIEGRFGESKRTVEYRDSLGRRSAAAPVMKEYVEILAASLDLKWLAVDMERMKCSLWMLPVVLGGADCEKHHLEGSLVQCWLARGWSLG